MTLLKKQTNKKTLFPLPEMTHRHAPPCSKKWLLLTSTCRWTQIPKSVVPSTWNGKYIYLYYASVFHLHVVKLWNY